jgi:hypothetical protein
MHTQRRRSRSRKFRFVQAGSSHRFAAADTLRLAEAGFLLEAAPVVTAFFRAGSSLPTGGAAADFLAVTVAGVGNKLAVTICAGGM